ncbi:MAG: hypothetical protein ABI614_11100 [Planctomycetota bacterium]
MALQGVFLTMSMTNSKPVACVVLAVGLLVAGAPGPAAMAQPASEGMYLNAETFGLIHKQIKPQPGESRWMEVAWLTDLHEARQRAAAEGKPLFIAASGKAISIGMC